MNLFPCNKYWKGKNFKDEPISMQQLGILNSIELERPILLEYFGSGPKNFPLLPYSIHLCLMINKAYVSFLISHKFHKKDFHQTPKDQSSHELLSIKYVHQLGTYAYSDQDGYLLFENQQFTLSIPRGPNNLIFFHELFVSM